MCGKANKGLGVCKNNEEDSRKQFRKTTSSLMLEL
jgi:hypothetical protein